MAFSQDIQIYIHSTLLLMIDMENKEIYRENTEIYRENTEDKNQNISERAKKCVQKVCSKSVFFFVRKEDLKSFHIKTASLKYDIQEEVCSFPSEKLFRNF